MSSYILIAILVLVGVLGALTIKSLKSIADLLQSSKKQQNHPDMTPIISQLKASLEKLESSLNANNNAFLQSLSEQISKIKMPEFPALPEFPKFPEFPEIPAKIEVDTTGILNAVNEQALQTESKRGAELTTALQEAAVLLRVNQAEFQAGLDAFHKSIDKLISHLPSNENTKDIQKEQMQKFEEAIISMQEKAVEAMNENSLRLQEILAEILKNGETR